MDGDPDHDYEVIAGTRRLFAITWLRRNSYLEIRRLAQVLEADYDAGFRLPDVENYARHYEVALKRRYGGEQVCIAERLRLSKGWRPVIEMPCPCATSAR